MYRILLDLRRQRSDRLDLGDHCDSTGVCRAYLQRCPVGIECGLYPGGGGIDGEQDITHGMRCREVDVRFLRPIGNMYGTQMDPASPIEQIQRGGSYTVKRRTHD